MLNDLIWMIQQYDWFVPALEDSKYYAEEQKKLQKIQERIYEENNIEVLEECLKHIPYSTGKHIQKSIKDRIQTLVIVYNNYQSRRR